MSYSRVKSSKESLDTDFLLCFRSIYVFCYVKKNKLYLETLTRLLY